MLIKIKSILLIIGIITTVLVLQDPYFKKQSTPAPSMVCIDGKLYIIEGYHKRKMTGVNGGDRTC